MTVQQQSRPFLRVAWALVAFLFLVAANGGTCAPVPTDGGSDAVGQADAGDDPTDPGDPGDPSVRVDPGDGYTLFAPISGTAVYLMDDDGQLVHSWETGKQPGQSVYLLDDGHLLHTEKTGGTQLSGGGSGGAVAEYAWDGELIWSYDHTTDTERQHHDVEPLPNGNVMILAWELKSPGEALAAGCDPALVSDEGLWSEHLLELDPARQEIVWEWHVWDHLAQDRDPSAANYVADVADHPGRVDVDYRIGRASADFLHANAIDYDPANDRLMVSVRGFSEIWILDHGVTTAAASGAAGDLLYRWGNPEAWGAGTSGDRQLYSQHDAKWIEPGLPGAGHVLVFDNGDQRLRAWSRVVELELPAFSAATGAFAKATGGSFGPAAPLWEYVADEPDRFYADHVSGAQRLPSGETQICDGVTGRMFRVDGDGTIGWEFAYGAGMFRAEFYAAEHPAFAGRTLTPQGPVPATGRPGPPNGGGGR